MRICFFGDSFVNGFGDPQYQGWVGRICAAAHTRGDAITAYNCGIRRATSDDIRATWLLEATARLPAEHKSAAVFSFGANDRCVEHGNLRVSLARQMENARNILATARERWPVLFIASPQLPDTIVNRNGAEQVQALNEICGGLAVPFLDAFAASAGFKHWMAEALAGDGAHPGAGGYGELAALVDAWPAWRGLLDYLKS